MYIIQRSLKTFLTQHLCQPRVTIHLSRSGGRSLPLGRKDSDTTIFLIYEKIVLETFVMRILILMM
jgi:hypothetical protein